MWQNNEYYFTNEELQVIYENGMLYEDPLQANLTIRWYDIKWEMVRSN